MKRNKYIKYIITSLTILTLSLIWVIVIYHSNKIDIESKLEPSLRVAIDRDLNTRFTKSGIPYSTSNTSTRINKGLISKDGKGEKSYSYRETNILRYTNTVDELIKQSCLNTFLPICPDTLNKYFNNELQLKNINATTAIKITDLIKKQSKTTQDTTLLYNSYDYIFSYLLGIEDELRLDAHIQYTLISILLYKGIIWLPLFICLCTLVTYIYLTRKLRQLKKEYKIVKLDENIYRLGESIFNKKEGILYKDNKPNKIRKQEAMLLIAFLEAPNYFLSINDINIVIWESEKIETVKRIYTLVSDLRGDVAPDLDIIKDSNKGYHLCLHAY